MKRLSMASLSLLLTAAVPAGAADPPVSEPGLEAAARSNYPRRALRERVSGEVSLKCAVEGRRLTGCEVVAENPKGYGFGDTALAIAGRVRVREDAKAKSVTFPIRFRPPKVPGRAA